MITLLILNYNDFRLRTCKAYRKNWGMVYYSKIKSSTWGVIKTKSILHYKAIHFWLNGPFNPIKAINLKLLAKTFVFVITRHRNLDPK
jgi:hypothetical protein